MLVCLTIGIWGATKADQEVSKDTNQRWGAQDRAGKYLKKLVENAFPRCKSVRNKASSFHRTNTLPWEDGTGMRLLPAKNFWTYMNRMKDLEREFEKSLISDIDEWPLHITKAKAILGDMFKRGDYPSPLELKQKFYFKSAVFPMPSASTFGNFITDLGQEAVEAIQKNLEERLQRSASGAFRDITKNFYELVKELIDKLQDPGYTPTSNMVSSLTKYMTMLPIMDFTENPELDVLRRETEAKLCTLNTDLLRQHNGGERGKAAIIAQDILDKMGAFWGE